MMQDIKIDKSNSAHINSEVIDGIASLGDHNEDIVIDVNIEEDETLSQDTKEGICQSREVFTGFCIDIDTNVEQDNLVYENITVENCNGGENSTPIGKDLGTNIKTKPVSEISQNIDVGVNLSRDIFIEFKNIDTNVKIEHDQVTEDGITECNKFTTLNKNMVTSVKIEQYNPDSEDNINDIKTGLFNDVIKEDYVIEDESDAINWDNIEIEENNAGEIINNDSAFSSNYSFTNNVKFEEKDGLKNLLEDKMMCSTSIEGESVHKSKTTKERKETCTKGADKTLVSCKLCPYKTTSKQLASHVKAHAADLSFCCENCHYRTVKKHKMLTHMQLHAPKVMYSCYLCNLEFSKKTSLTLHSLLHSNKGPFSCDECNRVFNDKGSFLRHNNKHSAVKVYRCDVCKKEFRDHRDLKNHYRVHSGLKPYTCDLCGKSFSERGNLRRHLRMHSGMKPHSCEVCKRSFNERHHLKRHMTTHKKTKKLNLV